MCVYVTCDSVAEGSSYFLSSFVEKKKLIRKVRKWVAPNANINRTIFIERIFQSETDFKPSGVLLNSYMYQEKEFNIFLLIFCGIVTG